MSPYPELDTYIQNARAAGMTDSSIRQALVTAGWALHDIEEALPLPPATLQTFPAPTKALVSIRAPLITITALLLVIVGLSGGVVFLWQDRVDLANKNSAAVRQFLTELSEGSIGFTDAGALVFPDDKKFIEKRDALIDAKQNFIEADLTDMRIRLYKEGSPMEEFPILAKGKDGSWWETPTGSYSVLTKSENHFSSIGEVWMPWSIQFYGNFFIHGWPYHENGEAVSSAYSGGCIRLDTADAEKVYAFASRGMPLLVREQPDTGAFGTLRETGNPVPSVTAPSFVVTNLSTGETLLSKRSSVIKNIGALENLMTGVVASELVYLERSTRVREEDLAALISAFEPKTGERYIAFDLLYPLLMQSSAEAKNILANFLGEKEFVAAMNAKAESLGMKDTLFGGNENSSTADDMATLLQYVYLKRQFLFDISRGEAYNTAGGVHAATIENFNDFTDDPRLIGMAHSDTSTAHSASAWTLTSGDGTVPIGIVVLDSRDREKDTAALLSWATAKTGQK